MSGAAIGFVGFGEAGFHIAKGLRTAGAANLFAFDIDTGERVAKRAAEVNVRGRTDNSIDQPAILPGSAVIMHFNAVGLRRSQHF
ncbi:MAG TPA: hypothetical protein VKB79_03370 [Bryobacteraceae bacterium]|nr:hypothetical protein [Bryobacteraceae bacterium]